MSKKSPLKVAVHNKKGGVGKSTICRALAAALQLLGYRVLVVDGDATQWTTHEWFEARRLRLGAKAALMPACAGRPPGVLHVLPVDAPSSADTAGNWDFIFYDLPGREDIESRAVLVKVDVVLVPLRPSHDDIKPLGGTMDLILKAGQARGAILPAYVIVNFLKRGTLSAKAIGGLAAQLNPGVKMMETQLRGLEDWTTAGSVGLCPIELDEAGLAAQDLSRLRDEFLKVTRCHG